ncbi:MAG: hypothetical protein HC821_05595 [Lewinella sp.]|nr:hypothetical protein [Lewinella sp.]
MVYPHPFASPQYEVLHTSELYIPDGTLVFSMPELVRGIIEPQQFFHLAYYEWARVYQVVYPGQAQPDLGWEALEVIGGFSQAKLEAFVGLTGLNTAAITVALYFTHGEAFLRQAAGTYHRITEVLRPPTEFGPPATTLL